MKCPFCAHLDDKVVDSREGRSGDLIRRRRECLKCGKRFTSYERIDQIPHLVVKKDGRRERFDREKVLSGLIKACQKRPVPVKTLEEIADFWDTHSLADYWDQTHEVSFEVRAQRRRRITEHQAP